MKEQKCIVCNKKVDTKDKKFKLLNNHIFCKKM